MLKEAFGFDTLGRRIEKVDAIAGTTTRYYYDDQRVVLRTQISGGVESDSRMFVFGSYLDEVLVMGCHFSTSWIDLYYAHDHLYSPTGQYTDGMNLYEYTKSKPFTNNDPYGLKTANDTNVCCKIKTTTTRYIPHGITTIVLPYQETSCTQMTISNPQGWSPGQACRCRYKNQKNVHVYNWHSGECCWCDVYIGWVTSPLPDGDADTDVRFHTKFYVKCDNNSSPDFTAETTPNDIEGLPSVGGLIIGGYPVLPRIDTGSSMHLKGYSWSYKGQISCANAEQAKMIASAETYWSVSHNCWHWAHQVANTVLDLCPYKE